MLDLLMYAATSVAITIVTYYPFVVVCETIQLSRFPYSGYSVLFRKTEAFCFTQKYVRIINIVEYQKRD